MALGALGAPVSSAQTWDVSGHALVRAVAAEGRGSWRDGGFGRLDLGAGDEDRDSAALARLHLILDGSLSSTSFYLHTVARAEPAKIEGSGDGLGLVEAYARYERDGARPGRRTALRLGHFILPTSRENVDVGWSSPYTLTFSALNTWIGEEVRLTGLDWTFFEPVGETSEMRFTVSAFGGNDTAGTLLAWRGWALGDRLTGFGETAALPPLPGLAPGGAFAAQQDEGTTPFGADLDGRVGWAAAWRLQTPQRGAVQLTAYDNRGDRELYGGEYAWQTAFYLAGADWTFDLPASRLTLASEWMWGETGMGVVDGRHVQLDFAARYLLASWEGERLRATVRLDDFETVERDFSSGYDPNDGDGEAWTLALFYQPVEARWRFGLELVDLDGRRRAAGLASSTDDTAGRTLSLEARFLF